MTINRERTIRLYIFTLSVAAVAGYYLLEGKSVARSATPVLRRPPAEYLVRDTSPAAVVSVSTTSGREDAAPPEAKDPVVAPPQKVPSSTNVGKRRAVSNLSPEARFCIEYHQAKIEELLPYMEGKDGYDEEANYGRAARVVALYSAVVVMAAEGQAIPSDVYKALSREEMEIIEHDGSFTMNNNGLYFPISRNRFGVFYQIKDLLSLHSGAVPVKELPFDQIVASAHEAMAYQIQ
jgi:hypothetical protein